MAKKTKVGAHVRLSQENTDAINNLKKREPYFGSLNEVANRAVAIGLKKLKTLCDVES